MVGGVGSGLTITGKWPHLNKMASAAYARRDGKYVCVLLAEGEDKSGQYWCYNREHHRQQDADGRLQVWWVELGTR